MINLKEIIWVEKNLDIIDYIYYNGVLNGCQVVTINTQYNKINIPTGYTVDLLIGNFVPDKVKYKTLEEAKLVAKKKVEDFVFGLIDMRDYKIDELLK